MKAASKNALGRGLAALIRDAAATNAPSALMTGQQEADQKSSMPHVLLALLKPGKFQPRQNFDPQSIDALAQSIQSSGIIQPILVRPDGRHYEIIAGERRYRAAQKAQLHKVPVIIREINDHEALQIALIENLQRAQLNPVEEAFAFQRLRDEFGHDQSEIASTIGKSRSYVANMVRLLTLPDRVQAMIMAGDLSAGHARALVVAADPETLAAIIVKKKLSVREAETLAARSPRAALARARPKPPVNVNIKAFEQNLSRKIGLAVSIRENKTGGGELRIRYGTLDQLENLTKNLTKKLGE